MIFRIASYILLFVILSSCGGGGGSSIENTNNSITQPPNNPFVYIPPSTTSTDNCVAKSQPVANSWHEDFNSNELNINGLTMRVVMTMVVDAMETMKHKTTLQMIRIIYLLKTGILKFNQFMNKILALMESINNILLQKFILKIKNYLLIQPKYQFVSKFQRGLECGLQYG